MLVLFATLLEVAVLSLGASRSERKTESLSVEQLQQNFNNRKTSESNQHSS
jgi:hypothetical protein